MRKTLVIAIMAFFSFASMQGAYQDKVKIDAAKKKQPAVVFPHSKHAGLKCETCHHTNKGLTAKSTDKVAKCSTCHLNPKDKKLPNMADMSMTKNPFHKLCVSCHKSAKKGPVVCAKCHVK